MLVLPADHEIKNIEAFHEIIKSGEQLARQGKLVTFGIVPSSPETGYGYIKKGTQVDHSNPAYMIERFVEKPDHATAVSYLESGDFCWNSGMFMFKASAVISELGAFVPDMLEKCRAAIKHGRWTWIFPGG